MFVKYITAIYFAVATVTTVGYGDIQARTQLENVVELFLMAIGSFIFQVILSKMQITFMKRTRIADEY